jgi:hypothetical protein
VAGAIGVAVATKTAAYTVTASDSYIRCDASAGAVTITLPTAAGITGRQYTVKKIDSSLNVCTIDPDLTETIDDAATYDLSVQYQYVTLISNGTNWEIIANN